MSQNVREIAGFIWTVADELLRDNYKRSEYADVIYPFTVIRRLDLILEPTHYQVHESQAKYKTDLKDLTGVLTKASGYAFYNTSKYTISNLLSENITKRPMKTPENNDKTYAACKADMLIKGEDPDKIKPKSSFSKDGFIGKHFDYIFSNPPYGKKWSYDEDFIRNEAKLGDKGRFGAGLPGISDGQLLFLQHMISKMHRDGNQPNGRVKIFNNTDFAYRKVQVDRPLRLNFQVSPERLAFLDEQTAFKNLAISKKKSPKEREKEEQAGIAEQEQIKKILRTIGDRIYKDWKIFESEIDRAFSKTDYKIKAPIKKGLFNALSMNDETAEIVYDTDGMPMPDSELRDHEYIPYEEDIRKYFDREVKPDVLDDDSKPTGKKKIIFPRYHQMDCVRKIISHAHEKGAGEQYLIMHSGGSGKSNTISWLSHQLSNLHDTKDVNVFDSIIVVTDRRIIDSMLRANVIAFEQNPGVVAGIDKGSKQLAGTKIIVSTLQKFPYIEEEIKSLPGKRFAIIIDEAHSSSSGEMSKSLKKVLNLNTEDDPEEEERTYEDEIYDEMKSRGRQPNISYFAFTATPKPKTLELFGSLQVDGSYKPFHVYSMKQAIQEGFIKDVLPNYITYNTYFKIIKKITSDPNYDKSKASRLLKTFVEMNEHTIEKKTKIIIDHFKDNCQQELNGLAKAMIVCSSRAQAVKYKIAFDRYIQDNSLDFKALVAFSGKKDPITLDFVNKAKVIQKAFQDFHEDVQLEEGSDPDKLYDFKRTLDDFHYYNQDDVEKFVAVFFAKNLKQEKLVPILQPVITNFKNDNKEQKEKFRVVLKSYVRVYAFLSQLISFNDPSLEKLYVFGKILFRKLPYEKQKLPKEVTQQVDLDSIKIQYSGKGIKVKNGGGGKFKPGDENPGGGSQEFFEPLSVIIKNINEKYATNFSEKDKIVADVLLSRLKKDKDIEEEVKNNPKENVWYAFERKFNKELQGFLEENFDF